MTTPRTGYLKSEENEERIDVELRLLNKRGLSIQCIEGLCSHLSQRKGETEFKTLSWKRKIGGLKSKTTNDMFRERVLERVLLLVKLHAA